MQRILVITGPTATGKTALGVWLAQAFRGEVVSADSMQVYRRMDIGTAKPTAAEMGGVPHHMLDRAEPSENYSVARYVREASVCVDDILRRGRLPILVGGSMLYVDSLIRGRGFGQDSGEVPGAGFGAGGESALRQALSAEYDRLGGPAMLEKLKAADPARAAILPPGDKRRIVRALEIYRQTGRTATELDAIERARPARYSALLTELSYADRQALYARIDSRVDEMRGRGLVKEVEALLDEGIDRSRTAMQAIGYKEIAAALCGERSMEEAFDSVKRESRRLAKRQLTWLRGRPEALRVRWEAMPDPDGAAERIVREFTNPTGCDMFSADETLE